MSHKSSDNSNDESIGLNSSESQTQDMNQNIDHNSDVDNEDYCGLTYPSLLQTHSSFPTELFHTLSPISLSQISSESTPIITNRRQPIGGEDLRNALLMTHTIHRVDDSVEEVLQSVSIEVVNDRPPLIGQTNSASESSRSTGFSINNKSETSIETKETSDADREAIEDRDVDRDALAAKVQQLLGRTKRQSNDKDFECESLGLIRVINESSDEKTSCATIASERSEPDGKGKPYLRTQTTHKLVYYSSSESEDNDSKSDSTSSSKRLQKSKAKSDENIENRIMRNRSFSASGRTGLKNMGFDISSFLRQRLRTNEISGKENSETQTNRSFLAEQAIHKEELTRVKRPTDASKAIQTSDSLLNIKGIDDKKQLKESSFQTHNNLGFSAIFKELLKNKQNSMKVSAGTQTFRSYLTEQALKQENREQNKQKDWKRLERKETKVKSIQTSYSSSHNSEFNSPIIENNSENLEFYSNDTKQPICWFIPIDKKSKIKNSSQISRTYSRSSVIKAKTKDHITEGLNSVPLQEAFNRYCVDMRMKSQIRVNRINTIADIRKRTADERLIEMAKQYIRQQESAKVIKTKIIQPVFKSSIKRFFTHEEMRAQTEKIYNNLPEVKAMREKKKQKEREKNQRLLAQIYKYRLKDNALKGRLTWKITQSCLN